MIRSTSAASVLIACVLTTSADARSETLALAGGRLVDGYGGPPLDNAVVLVKGSRIDAIGRVGAIAIPSGARVIDTNGMTVMPGLWESHGHLLHIGAGNPGEFVSHFADRKTEIMAIVAELNLMAGVTSFRNASGPLEEQKQLREAIESGKKLGPRLYLTGRSIENHPERDRAADGVSNFYRLTTPQAAREAAEQLIASNIDQIQIGGFWKLPVLEALVDAAHRAGIGVDAEARHVSAMRTAVRAGVDRLHVVFAASPLSEYSDEDMRLLVRGAKPVALGPSSNILRGPYFVSTMEMRQSYVRVLDFPEILDHPRFRKQFPPDIYDYMRRSWSSPQSIPWAIGARERMKVVKQKFRRFIVAGGREQIVAGCDSGTPVNFHVPLPRELANLVEVGLSPMEAIQSATLRPAQMQGVDADLGTIEVGKFADLIVVDGDPLQDITLLKHGVLHVIKDGRFYR